MSDSIVVETKYDYELNKKELNQIFIVYNECFFQNRVRKKDLAKQIKKKLNKGKIFQWYLLRNRSTRQIMGIGSYVYDYSSVINGYSVDIGMGENICNIGVPEQYRKRGYATQIVQKIIGDHSNQILTLEVKLDSKIREVLVAFYQKMGFRKYKQNSHGIYLRREAK